MTSKHQALRNDLLVWVEAANERLAALEQARKLEHKRLKGQYMTKYNQAMGRYRRGERKTKPKFYNPPLPPHSPAYEIAMNDLKNLGIKGDRFTVIPDATYQQTNKQLSKVNKFLRSKSSDPEWIKEANERRLVTLSDRVEAGRLREKDMNTLYRIFKTDSWKILCMTVDSDVALELVVDAMSRKNVGSGKIVGAINKTLAEGSTQFYDNDLMADLLEENLDDL